MKTLLLLSLLLSLLVPFQGPVVSSDASPLDVGNFKWSRARRNVDAPPVDVAAVRAATDEGERATLLEMMNTHLSTTAAELGARLSKDWEGDVKAFDAVYDHILHMADALSDGIIKQFPEKFGGGVASTTGR